MADRSVVVELIAKTGRFTGPLAGASAATRGLSQEMKGARGRGAQLGGAMGALGGKMGAVAGAAVGVGAAIGGGLVLAGAGAIKMFADFDAKMTQSLAIMGEVSETQREDMVQAARAVGRETTFGANEAAEAYFFLASAGMDAAQATEALPQVAQFAQAGMFDLARATDLATDAQSALGLSVKDPGRNLKNLTRVTDVLVKANTLANATVEQFSESLTNKAGAAMKAFGIDVEEGVAVLAAYADQGLKGKAAGEAFEIITRDILKAVRENSEAFEEQGITLLDNEGNFRNMADVIAELEGAFGGLSAEQQSALASQLGFQDRSFKNIRALLGQSEAIRQYEEDLRSAAGTTEEVADKQLDTLSAQFDLLKSKIADAGIELGSKLEPAFRDMLPAIESMIDSFISFAESVAPLVIGAFKGIASFADLVADGLLSIRSLFDDNAKAALRMDEAYEHVVNRIAEGASAQDTLADSMLHIVKNGAATEARIRDLGDAAGAEGEALGAATAAVLEHARAEGMAADQIKILEDVLLDEIMTYKETEEAILATAEKYGLQEEAAERLAEQSAILAEEQAALAAEEAAAAAEAEAAAQAQAEIEEAERRREEQLETLAGSLRAARDAQESLTDAVLRFANPAFNAARAMEGVSKATERLEELEKEGKKGTEEYAQAMLELASANLEAQAALDALDASGVNDAIASIAAALDIPKEAAAELLTQLGLIDGTEVSTVVEVETVYSSRGTPSGASGGFRGGGGFTPRQHGGPLGAGMPSLVGERGPELFIPSTAGHVVASQNVTINRGGPTVNIDRPESFDLPQDIATGLIMGGIVERVEGGALERI